MCGVGWGGVSAVSVGGGGVLVNVGKQLPACLWGVGSALIAWPPARLPSQHVRASLAGRQGPFVRQARTHASGKHNSEVHWLFNILPAEASSAAGEISACLPAP